MREHPYSLIHWEQLAQHRSRICREYLASNKHCSLSDVEWRWEYSLQRQCLVQDIC
jgi:hypothetical protein